MNKLSVLAFAALTFVPSLSQAAELTGTFYANAGVTQVSDGSDAESAYFTEVGYNHKLDEVLSVNTSVRRVITFDSSVSADSDDFVQTYDAYSLGLRADQDLGDISLYGVAGASYITSETKTWDSVNSVVDIVNDDSFKPYARAGISFDSTYSDGMTFDAGINYQMLSGGRHATSFIGGVNIAF